MRKLVENLEAKRLLAIDVVTLQNGVADRRD
jgi:hypothetical protein